MPNFNNKFSLQMKQIFNFDNNSISPEENLHAIAETHFQKQIVLNVWVIGLFKNFYARTPQGKFLAEFCSK